LTIYGLALGRPGRNVGPKYFKCVKCEVVIENAYMPLKYIKTENPVRPPYPYLLLENLLSIFDLVAECRNSVPKKALYILISTRSSKLISPDYPLVSRNEE
jgi:hypothetical protein